MWGNFSQWTTERCHKANPSVGLLFSMPRCNETPQPVVFAFCRFVKLYILFYAGLLPFVPLKETHLEIPMPSIFYDNNYRFPKPDNRGEHILTLSRAPEANVGLGKLPKWSLCLADYIMMSPTLFNHLNRRGIHTYLWVLNSEEEYARWVF